MSTTYMFVAVMPPTTLPRLACSRSKAEFLEHLGLTEGSEIYKDMMNEANEGRQRSCSRIENLTPDARHQDPPYSSNQILESVKHQEVLNIYHNASPQTRRVYDLGREWNGQREDNWIIRWCFWHVFRYRDDRNRSRNVNSSNRDSTHSRYQTRNSSQEEDSREEEKEEQQQQQQQQSQQQQNRNSSKFLIE